MSFIVYTDGTANLPGERLGGIRLLPCEYTVDGVPCLYNGDVDSFDGHEYYEGLKNGKMIKTSLLNTYLFIESFTPVLEAGEDVIYISMASGISGTYQAAMNAADELMETFKERTVRIIDSKGCGFGSGLLALYAEELRKQGMNCNEAADILDERVPHMCQYFTVDDLNFLKRSGRVSGASAVIGTVLNIKPILYGTNNAKIEVYEKVRGRKKAIEALVKQYSDRVVNSEEQIVAISHGDCLEDANTLAKRILDVAKPKDLIICQHEPFSGAHVGPGMLAVFFYGTER